MGSMWGLTVSEGKVLCVQGSYQVKCQGQELRIRYSGTAEN